VGLCCLALFREAPHCQQSVKKNMAAVICGGALPVNAGARPRGAGRLPSVARL